MRNRPFSFARTALSTLLGLGLAMGAAATSRAYQAAEAPRAARSVHLWYPAPDATTFYNEVTVEQSQRASYFCAAGFAHGYFGIQELGNGKKVVIFSVWEPGEQNDPNSVAADRRVELLSRGDGVRAGRFGGEGTGGQSFFDYDWKIGETCRMLVKAKPDGNKTTFTGYFFRNDTQSWQKMASFRTLTGGALLKGFYSFVEDFRRDGRSAREVRRASYGNGWVQTADGRWQPLLKARFTADNTPTTNVDAGVRDGRFFLVTGGDTPNVIPLKSEITRDPLPKPLPE